MINITEFLVKKHTSNDTIEQLITKLIKMDKNPFATRNGAGHAIVLKYWVSSKDDMWIRSSENSNFASIENLTEYLRSFYEDGNFIYFSFTSYLILNTRDTSHYNLWKDYEKLIKKYKLEYDMEDASNKDKNDKEIYIHIKDFESDMSKLYDLLNDEKIKSIFK